MQRPKLREVFAADFADRVVHHVLVSHLEKTWERIFIHGNPALLAQLPAHKTLFHAPPGKGLPIGNLNSQFFANVYLNALDQFAKHTLKCRWYLRYCDDFVLLAESAEQLLAWRAQIEQFLADTLALQLNARRQRLCPVADGLDFLGYIVRPTHLLVRRRVVGHLQERLQQAKRRLVQRQGRVCVLDYVPEELDALQASLASYLGHLRPAASARLLRRLLQQHAWLAAFVSIDPATLKLRRRDLPPQPTATLAQQYAHWQREFAHDEVWMQVGAFAEQLRWPPRGWVRGAAGGQAESVPGVPGLRGMRPNRRGARVGFPVRQLQRRVAGALARGRSVMWVAQMGGDGAAPLQRRPLRRWV